MANTPPAKGGAQRLSTEQRRGWEGKGGWGGSDNVYNDIFLPSAF